MRSGRRVAWHDAPYVWVRMFDRRIDGRPGAPPDRPLDLRSIPFPGVAPGLVRSSYTSVGAEQ